MARTTGYTLDNTWDKARRRVTALEQVLDPRTTGRLSQLPIGFGWRCLEVGAGAGSVARWLCEQVGATGSVTAVDLEPTLLRDQPRPNLEIVQADVTADPLPGEDYDLAHARFLLVHVPNREQLVASMLERLRPGGVILLEEADFFPMVTIAESPAYAELWARVCRLAVTRGGDWLWGRHLPARLCAAGADEVSSDIWVDYCHSGTPMAELLLLSVEQLAPLLQADGAEAALIEAATAAIRHPASWLPAFACVTAAGRRSA